MKAEELRVLWQQRDERYANRPVRLGLFEVSEASAVMVRAWRRDEASEVEEWERALMMAEAAAWEVPASRLRK